MKALIGVILGALAGADLAAPSAFAQGTLPPPAGYGGPAVLQIAERRCAPGERGRNCRQGQRHRNAQPRPKEQGYGYSYGAPRAEFYPAGSSAWWQAMEREGRTGITPD
jgi:hypothetical protein